MNTFFSLEVFSIGSVFSGGLPYDRTSFLSLMMNISVYACVLSSGSETLIYSEVAFLVGSLNATTSPSVAILNRTRSFFQMNLKSQTSESSRSSMMTKRIICLHLVFSYALRLVSLIIDGVDLPHCRRNSMSLKTPPFLVDYLCGSRHRRLV